MNLEEKVDKLKNETIALRKEVVIMKTLIKQQNETIKELLNTQADESNILNFTESQGWFPIRTKEQLDNLEQTINIANQDAIVYEARICLQPGGILQSLHKILDEELLSSFNLEGNYNKGRLLDYGKVLDVLHKASDCDDKTFITDFRHAVAKTKKRYLKRKGRQQSAVEGKKVKLNDTEDENAEDDEECTKEDLQEIIKTGEWFPIRTQKELDLFEKSVNSSNRKSLVADVEMRIRQAGLGKTLEKLLDDTLIVNYNLEGTYNKRRLLDYDNLMDIFSKAAQNNGWDYEKFIAELRIAIRKIKKKKYKETTRKRSQNWKSDTENEDDDY